MKKILLSILLVVMSASLLFGAIGTYETNESHSFQPLALMSPRVIGMGGAGLALEGTMENRLMNPANSAGEFSLSLPYLSVSVYNIKNNLDNITEIAEENGRLSLYDAAFSFLNTIPGGERNFMSIDLGAGVALRYISIYGFFNADVFTFGPGDLSSTIGLDMDLGMNAALSYEKDYGNGYGVSFGLGFSAITKNITADSTKLTGVGVGSISEVFEEYQDDVSTLGDALFEFFDGFPVSSGNSYPVSLGVRGDFPYGFSLSLALNNMNGHYRMSTNTNENYVIHVPMTLDLGFGWTLDEGRLWYHLLQPTVALDIVDIVGMFQDGLFEKGVFIDHLKMGAELNFLTVCNARCGLDRGYFTFGLGVDMYALNVDLSYGVRPYGPSREGRFLDYVKLRVNVGFDRP